MDLDQTALLCVQKLNDDDKIGRGIASENRIVIYRDFRVRIEI